MISIFELEHLIYVVQSKNHIDKTDISKLFWLFNADNITVKSELSGSFIGPRKEMITPWSTNAVEICQNMGIIGIERIEEFYKTDNYKMQFDAMLQSKYTVINQNIFTIDIEPEPIQYIEKIEDYNEKEGLALSNQEIEYLYSVAKKLNRNLTDSEIYGFAQVNSEHCRHKIFNGTFIIDGEEKQQTLFELIKATSKANWNRLVSAYKDNVAFFEGSMAEQFAPERGDVADFFKIKEIKQIISLKAETHNFPTTVEPFNGASTGSGGEIRDRMAGGKGSLPLAGTAVYMTSYPRNKKADWEHQIKERPWLYHNPESILIKASNGASDFGNKFGQPLICGSLLTFEHSENNQNYGYDKVIMLAGGIGFANEEHSQKDEPHKSDAIIVMGGDNYRIGMGGGAVSSVNTGIFSNNIELNAVQRANPEMQKRVYNVIRALTEAEKNPIVSIHDHGAGGHLNSLSELIENTGGIIKIGDLPIGDPTLSDKEIIGNESQERMGLVMNSKDIALLEKIASRERAPFYIVGEATGDNRLVFENNNKQRPIDLELSFLFGNPPKTVLRDINCSLHFSNIESNQDLIENYLTDVLRLESVACKDWLTNKVDRSVTGRIALQQCLGEIQLPLNNLGIITNDYTGKSGVATSIGHAPAVALISPEDGSVLSISEALLNLIWTPIRYGLKGISLSANWMWPAKNTGENTRLYKAVEAASNFAIALGINIPTGKDSLSMTQKYKDSIVFAPGTVIISAVGEASDIKNAIKPLLKLNENTSLVYIDFSLDAFELGGSALAQTMNKIGKRVSTIKDYEYFKKSFELVQQLIAEKRIIAGHDVSAGGLITALLEMNFANTKGGMEIDLTNMCDDNIVNLLFSEKPAIIIQCNSDVIEILKKQNIHHHIIGKPNINSRTIKLRKANLNFEFEIEKYRDIWFSSSYYLEQKQTSPQLAKNRYENYKFQPLSYKFPEHFNGTLSQYNITQSRRNKTSVKAAIIREKGVNGDREMAYAMHLAGFDVKDIHMTDLISGRENLEDVNFIAFVGGFSNSDVLGSAKGWAGAFIYNEKAAKALDNFYKRMDTLSLGVCNGCQLMVELGLIYPEHEKAPKMLHNDSHKFESAFLSVNILQSNCVMLKTLENSNLGVWIAHGEGKFSLPYEMQSYNIPVKYSYSNYPGNPNGSEYDAAAICSHDGRHLAIMPHLERSFYPWQWAYYPENRLNDEVSPWIEAFVNAKKWIIERTQ